MRAGFSEVGGLVDRDRHHRVPRRRRGHHRPQAAGQAKYTNISLKRGFTRRKDLWDWRKKVMDGKTQRLGGTITLLDEARKPALAWKFCEAGRRSGPARRSTPRTTRSPSRSWRSASRASSSRRSADPMPTPLPAPRASTSSGSTPNPQRIGPRRTDVAGFVGIAERGPLHTPVKIESSRQFTDRPSADRCRDGYLAYAVAGFFENGGRTCWVVRVADPARRAACAFAIAIDGRARRSSSRRRAPGRGATTSRSRRVWGRRPHRLTCGRATPGSARTSRSIWTRAMNPDRRAPSATNLLGVRGRRPAGAGAGRRSSRVEPDSIAVRCPARIAGRARPRGGLPEARDGLAALDREHFTGDPDGRAPLGARSARARSTTSRSWPCRI